MKRAALSILAVPFLLAAPSLRAQNPAPRKPATARYYVVFLRRDPSRKELPKPDGDRLQSAHMANIQKMARDGFLVAAGPFDDNPVTISGIFLFTLDSLASAQALAARDPTVVAHRNTVEVHAWKGPPAIGAEYFRLHKLNPNTPENMQARPLCLFYRGAFWDRKQSAREGLLKAHGRYIDRLHDQGKLGAAGAFETPGDLLALAIFKPISLNDAQLSLRDDPAVQAGVLRVDLHTWWSSDHVLPW
jgi:uncharacterized protein